MSLSFPTLNAQKASEIPSYCSQLAQALLDQPDKIQIPRERLDEIRICEILSKNSVNVLKIGYEWDHRFVSRNGQLPPTIDVVELDDQLARSSLDSLQGSYDRVLTSMATGWVRDKIEENPAFTRFVKDKPLIQESLLIESITKSFFLMDDVHSYDADGKTYLWVRKSAFEKVVNTIGFKF